MFELYTLLPALPLWYWQLVAFGFGVVIGSFLNVFIYRLHTGKSLSGSSHCLSCGRPLRWYELFPLLSYIALRGRCRTCGCRVPLRYFVVELTTGLLFAASVTLSTALPELLLWWLIWSILIVILVYDYYHYIIPDELTLALLVAVIALRGAAWWQSSGEMVALLVLVGAAAAGSAFFWLLWYISSGRWLGFGDVKLAFPLGLLVGPALVFSFVVYAFWIGAVISLALIGWQHLKRGKAGLQSLSSGLTMKSAVPFAPFLIASGTLLIFYPLNVLTLFSFA
ncbi:MAG: prepilin peptidase [Patescibacteria group bacterium]